MNRDCLLHLQKKDIVTFEFSGKVFSLPVLKYLKEDVGANPWNVWLLGIKTFDKSLGFVTYLSEDISVEFYDYEYVVALSLNEGWIEDAVPYQAVQKIQKVGR